MLSNVSIRAWHPQMSATHVSSHLGLDPEYFTSIGDPRAAPNGRLLGGVNEQTYVCARLVYKECVELGAQLSDCYEDLRERHAFIHEIVESGGEVEFYVSIFLKGLGGFCLDPELVKKFAVLGIGLSVELYPDDE